MRRLPVHCLLASLLGSALLVATARSQAKPWPADRHAVNLDSGHLDNPASVDRVRFRASLRWPGSTWVRLQFGISNLPAGSLLRLTGRDGAVQVLDAVSLRDYGDQSAFLNGAEVLVELVAARGSRANRVTVIAATTGRAVVLQEDICGSGDNRVRSFDPRVGRLSSGCTAFLVGRELALTAGHCATPRHQLIEFAVPLSTASGQPIHSHPDDQYPVLVLAADNSGVGADWAVLRTLPNSNTGRIPAMANHQRWFQPGIVPGGPGGALMRVTGFGQSSSPRLNLAQQTHPGPLTAVQATAIGHRADTRPGSSGSPILEATTELILGIHTGGGCATRNNPTWGTRIDAIALTAALRSAESGRASTFGYACPNSVGLPRLSIGGTPALGRSFAVLATNPPIGETGALLFGRSRSHWLGGRLPLALGSAGMPGCELLVSAEVGEPLGTGLGTTGLALPVPSQVGLIGVHLHAQYLFRDPGLNAAGAALTNGVEIVLGR